MIIHCANCGKQHKACRKTQKFCSQKCCKVWQYAHGLKVNVESAHQTIRTRGHYKRDNTYLKTRNPAKTTEARQKISESKRGDKNAMYGKVGELHHNWRGGKHKTVWKSVEYQRWRKAVFSRDDYTCVGCGDKSGGNLEADHIKPRYLYPELTFDINNGRTLCKSCHRNTPTWGARVRKMVRV